MNQIVKMMKPCLVARVVPSTNMFIICSVIHWRWNNRSAYSWCRIWILDRMPSGPKRFPIIREKSRPNYSSLPGTERKDRSHSCRLPIFSITMAVPVRETKREQESWWNLLRSFVSWHWMGSLRLRHLSKANKSFLNRVGQQQATPICWKHWKKKASIPS